MTDRDYDTGGEGEKGTTDASTSDRFAHARAQEAAQFRLSTADPDFDPSRPIQVNGFWFSPVRASLWSVSLEDEERALAWLTDRYRNSGPIKAEDMWTTAEMIVAFQGGWVSKAEELIGPLCGAVAPLAGQKPGAMSPAEVAEQERVVSAMAPIVEAVAEADDGPSHEAHPNYGFTFVPHDAYGVQRQTSGVEFHANTFRVRAGVGGECATLKVVNGRMVTEREIELEDALVTALDRLQTWAGNDPEGFTDSEREEFEQLHALAHPDAPPPADDQGPPNYGGVVYGIIVNDGPLVAPEVRILPDALNTHVACGTQRAPRRPIHGGYPDATEKPPNVEALYGPIRYGHGTYGFTLDNPKWLKQPHPAPDRLADAALVETIRNALRRVAEMEPNGAVAESMRGVADNAAPLALLCLGRLIL